jgi:hypothetical protein
MARGVCFAHARGCLVIGDRDRKPTAGVGRPRAGRVPAQPPRERRPRGAILV